MRIGLVNSESLARSCKRDYRPSLAALRLGLAGRLLRRAALGHLMRRLFPLVTLVSGCGGQVGSILWTIWGVAELIREIPAGTRRRFVERIIGRLLENDTENCFTTLDTYFKCDCDLQRTSANLFIHRNTLVYRLRKIRELTGLEPRLFSDAMQLQMALMLNGIRPFMQPV